MSALSLTEYVWVDGTAPCQQIRSVYRSLRLPAQPQLEDFDTWYFDGSITGQVIGSRFALKPVRVYLDPFQAGGNYLVLCELYDSGGNAHASNYRASLRAALRTADEFDPSIGYEQIYMIVNEESPRLATQLNGMSGSCFNVGLGRAFGRDIAETHARACLQAGISLGAMYAGKQSGVWHFQLGYPASEDSVPDLLRVTDDLWLARHLLHRISEQTRTQIAWESREKNTDPQSMRLLTRFSTAFTRDSRCSQGAVQAIVDILQSSTYQSESTTVNPLTYISSAMRKGNDYVEVEYLSAPHDPYRIGIHMIGAIPG